MQSPKLCHHFQHNLA